MSIAGTGWRKPVFRCNAGRCTDDFLLSEKRAGVSVHNLNRIARLLLKRFGLEKKAPGVLHKERRGIAFTDVQRRINLYLRALWARELTTAASGRDYENRDGFRPSVVNGIIWLPDAYEDFGEIPASLVYRAAAAHAASHIVFSRGSFSQGSLDNWQIAVISVIEDARVETLAIRKFPGLKRTWAKLHTATPGQAGTAGDYLSRLARALLDETYPDMDPWVVQGRALFNAVDDLENNLISREIGVILAHSFREKNIPFRLHEDLLNIPYRDDNRHLWESKKFDFSKAINAGRNTRKKVLKYASLFGMTNTVADGAEGEAAKKSSVLAAIFNFKLDFGNISEQESRESVSAPFHYAEWDYRAQIERPSWVLVLEKRAREGDLKIIEDIIARNRHLISRMKILLDAIQPEGVQRIRKLEEGDEIDINAAIRARIDIKLGIPPDSRIMMSSVRKTRDISVMVLLDLSKSTNGRVQGQEHTVLQLTREACVLLADAIEKVGDPFAIHGFCSDSRHHVEYFRLKDFGQPYNDLSRAKLAGMTGQLSTRMGAAIRHATHYLDMQKSGKKLMMVITDGEPADVDVRDSHYLRHDAKKAVEEARRSGIHTYCMSLDASADQYVSRIFGMRNYMVVDHVNRLPEKLPLLYAGLTR